MEVRVMRRIASVCLLLLIAACTSEPKEPVKVTGIDLSHEVDEKNEPRSARETFAPTSTVYASIAVEGTGSATLAARWTDPTGKVISEETKAINPEKPQRYEFHISPPAGGFPLGRYKGVFTLDGGSPRTREFEIR